MSKSRRELGVHFKTQPREDHPASGTDAISVLVGASSSSGESSDRFRQVEEALRGSEERFRLVAETAPAMIWEAGADLGCTFLNQQWLDFTGRNLEMELGSGWLEGVHPDDLGDCLATYRSAFAARKPFTLEYRLRRADGCYAWVADTGVPRFTPDGRLIGYIGSCFDIDERKRHREELLQAKESLELRVEERTQQLTKTIESLREEIAERIRLGQALEEEVLQRQRVQGELREKELLLLQQSRLAAMGEMVGNIAHQWRQPLNVLGLLAQELQMTFKRGELTEPFVEESTRKTWEVIQHMSKTVDDFRNFFLPDKERVPFRVSEVVARTLSLLDGSLSAAQIRTEIRENDAPVVIGYPSEFCQVLLNILNNARDAFLGHHVEGALIIIEIGKEGERAVVTITDNAGGIPPEIIDRIFDPYFTTKDRDVGTGVGLSMSKSIIENSMNGTLSARNADRGAEFRIEL